jgi:ornithine cyclodeaminase/alanine dehydrogenase-like protein (mu-crystallin family)
MSIVILTEDEIRQSISVTQSIDAIEAAFAALAHGSVSLLAQR